MFVKKRAEREEKVERGWRGGGEGAERIRGVEDGERKRDMKGWRKGYRCRRERGLEEGKLEKEEKYSCDSAVSAKKRVFIPTRPNMVRVKVSSDAIRYVLSNPRIVLHNVLL